MSENFGQLSLEQQNFESRLLLDRLDAYVATQYQTRYPLAHSQLASRVANFLDYRMPKALEVVLYGDEKLWWGRSRYVRTVLLHSIVKQHGSATGGCLVFQTNIDSWVSRVRHERDFWESPNLLGLTSFGRRRSLLIAATAISTWPSLNRPAVFRFEQKYVKLEREGSQGLQFTVVANYDDFALAPKFD